MGMLVSLAANSPSGLIDPARSVELPLSEPGINREAVVAAMALGARNFPTDQRPRWWDGEDGIVAAAVAVILVALLTIIVVAAAAILTMG